ncbi:MAG TPA: amino acid permease [Ilumatobacteraceae bacterium]|nr:amino acid permease [Ilumatobacteraceae bacterium]HQY86327.1 amino acid permease [Ilumatobacteraceae bacterium]
MADTVDEDRDHLHSMGYAQELHRGMSTFSNFAISFSIISILAGGMTSFWLGMVTSGPRVITMGWIIVGFFALLVGMAMGEICSAYPTAGGLYYWSAKLARKNQARWSWFTGYFNLIGQIGVIASVDYALSIFIGYFIRMFDDSFELTTWKIFGIYLAVLVVHGLLNTFRVELVKILGDISVWWHVVGVVIIAGVLFIAPSNKRGIGGAFDSAPPGMTGWTGGVMVTIYLFGLGLLLAQYTITGFDASAHVSEETVGARTEAPKAIVRSIYISAIAALVLNLSMIAALPKKSDVDGYTAIAFGGGGDLFLVNAAPRLISSAVGTGMAKFLVLIAIVGQFFCGLASVTANSRMIYAFSRDGALPGSKFWHKVNKKTRTPTNSVWFGVTLAALVGTLSLYQKGGFSTAFFALTGICVIGLYISYAIPIYLRLTNPDFVVGPWNLKGKHKLVGWTALVWIGFISILFIAPLFWPFWGPFGETEFLSGTPDAYVVFHQNNFNFTGPLILIAAAFVLGYWTLSGKKWFTGPKVQGTKEELLAIERELDAVEHGKAL